MAPARIGDSVVLTVAAGAAMHREPNFFFKVLNGDFPPLRTQIRFVPSHRHITVQVQVDWADDMHVVMSMQIAEWRHGSRRLHFNMSHSKTDRIFGP